MIGLIATITPAAVTKMKNLIAVWSVGFFLHTGQARRGMQNDVKYLGIITNVFVRTGYLLTATDEYDILVCPEGIPDYKVPPPSMVEPSSAAPGGNETLEVEE